MSNNDKNVELPKHEYDVVTLLQIEKGVEMWKAQFPGSSRFYTYKVSQSHTPVYPGAQVVVTTNDSENFKVVKLVEQDHDFQPALGVIYQWVVAVLPSLDTLQILPKNDASARLRIQLGGAIQAAKTATEKVPGLNVLPDQGRVLSGLTLTPSRDDYVPRATASDDEIPF